MPTDGRAQCRVKARRGARKENRHGTGRAPGKKIVLAAVLRSAEEQKRAGENVATSEGGAKADAARATSQGRHKGGCGGGRRRRKGSVAGDHGVEKAAQGRAARGEPSPKAWWWG